MRKLPSQGFNNFKLKKIPFVYFIRKLPQLINSCHTCTRSVLPSLCGGPLPLAAQYKRTVLIIGASGAG